MPNSRSDATKDQEAYDKFVARKVFSDPSDIFTKIPPRLADLVGDCLFVFDTNALLASYKLTGGSVGEIERILKGIAENDRLFIPAQVAREFGKHRSTAQKEVFDILHRQMSNIPVTPKAETLRLPMLEHSPAYQSLIQSIGPVRESIKTYKSHLNSLLDEMKDWAWTDRVSVLYAELFPGRIVDHGKSDEDILRDLNWRTIHSLPPGYKDKAKDDGGVGDLLIWHTILELGKQKKKHIVFVCNEEKPDWIIRSHDAIIGTREELRQEFVRETGQFFSLTNYSSFLKLLGANRETVSQAERIEEDDSLEFIVVQQRVGRILGAVHDIVAGFLAEDADAGMEYEYIRDKRLDGLVQAFIRARQQFDVLVHSESGSNLLADTEASLLEIRDLNQRLRFFEAQMKRSGDREMHELRQACNDFIGLSERWIQLYLVGSLEAQPID